MSERHSHRWLAWLLPLLLLRALLPVGFMLSWSDAGLRIVMCSGSGPLPTHVPTVEEQQHPGDSHRGGGQHEHSRADNAALCPFAVAGTSGALPSFDAVVAFAATVSHRIRGLPAFDLAIPAVLIDRIRGPPLA
jgi:Protein of unknown function (DUF2946)